VKLGRLTAVAIGAALLITAPVTVGAQSDGGSVDAAALAACDGDTFTELGVVVPYLGFELDLENAAVDESQWVTLDMLITNSTGRGDLRGNGIGMQYIEFDGATYPVRFASSITMLEGLPSRGQLQAGPFPDEFSLCEAVLYLGRPTEYQSTLPLVAGAEPVFATPLETKFARKKHTRNKKKLAQATLRQSTAYPAACTTSGWGEAVDTDTVGIVLSVDQRLKTSNYWHSADLIDPNGEEWDATNGRDWIGSTGRRPADYCFNVAAPVGGKYKLRLNYGDGGIQIPFQLSAADFYGTETEEDVSPETEDIEVDPDPGELDDEEAEPQGEPSGIEA